MQSVALLLASLACVLYESIRGFVALRELCVPAVAAVHGAMIGGAAAIFLQTDQRIAERGSTFQHGNLSRGVCPVAWHRLVTLESQTVRSVHVCVRNAICSRAPHRTSRAPAAP